MKNMSHLPVAFDATPEGRVASYRCVRCATHWPAEAAPPAACRGRRAR